MPMPMPMPRLGTSTSTTADGASPYNNNNNPMPSSPASHAAAQPSRAGSIRQAAQELRTQMAAANQKVSQASQASQVLQVRQAAEPSWGNTSSTTGGVGGARAGAGSVNTIRGDEEVEDHMLPDMAALPDFGYLTRDQVGGSIAASAAGPAPWGRVRQMDRRARYSSTDYC